MCDGAGNCERVESKVFTRRLGRAGPVVYAIDACTIIVPQPLRNVMLAYTHSHFLRPPQARRSPPSCPGMVGCLNYVEENDEVCLLAPLSDRDAHAKIQLMFC